MTDVILYAIVYISIQLTTDTNMSQKNNPISVRVSDEDLAFLNRLSIDDAETPSEKMRAVIKQAKRRQAGQYSYHAALGVIRELLEPVAGQIRELERKEDRHSELLINSYHWAKELTAYMLSGIDQEKDQNELIDLATLEANVLDRLLRQMEYILRLAVTREGPCYDGELVRSKIKHILELAMVVQTQMEREEAT